MTGPTRIRGSSDAYGSWNISCRSRRRRCSADLRSLRQVLALEPDRAGRSPGAARRSASRSSSCRSPTRRRARTSRRGGRSNETSETAFTVPSFRWTHDARGHRELLHEVVDLAAAPRAAPAAAPFGPAVRLDDPNGSSGLVARLARGRRPTGWKQAKRCVEAAGVEPLTDSGQRRLLDPAPLGRVAAARREAAGRRGPRTGPAGCPGSSTAPASGRGRGAGSSGRAPPSTDGASPRRARRCRRPSTILPAYITITRSRAAAITPMSCVIRITAIRRSRRRSSIRSRICAWIVTSSAVVGSSAISSFGAHASAIAIITRWRRPPESWCG